MKTYEIEQIGTTKDYKVIEVDGDNRAVVVTDLPIRTAELIRDALTLWRDHLGVEGTKQIKEAINKDVEELESINRNE